jgi:CRP-like cAMP-binding protein
MSEVLNVTSELAKTSLFASLQPDALEQFASQADVKTFDKGSIFFLHEDKADWFYVIVSGWVKLFRETLEGHEAVIDVLSEGHVFGDSAVLTDDIHTNSAAAAEKTTVIRIPVSFLKRAIDGNHDMALAMLKSLASHRKQQTREIEGLTLQSASQRIGCFLLRLCNDVEQTDIDLKLPYDKSLIAARLGMKPETFSRALNKLRQETNIAVKGNCATIPDVQNLTSFACGACSNEFPCETL